METKKIVYEIVEKAISCQTSDIFLLPKKGKINISFRTGRGVVNHKTFSLDYGKEIINFFKYAAQMDISEHRRPQVGAMTFEYHDMEYFLRLSSLGDFDDHESLVIRIIYQIQNSKYFFEEQLKELKSLSAKRGLIVTSGPTGSGKTTTMYELAKEIGENKVIMTIEDPVEVHEQSFLQTQVNSEAGIDYLSLLKAALRHRPDILIIGEIRDKGTARLAVDAALSGHLVLATVHAKSTLQTISRLEGLDISKEELANCLTALSYQRLIPTDENGNLACLMDLASGKILQESICKEIRDNFVCWKQNLEILRKEKKISDANYELYKEG